MSLLFNSRCLEPARKKTASGREDTVVDEILKGLGDDPSQEQQQEPEDEQIVECKIYIKHKLKKI